MKTDVLISVIVPVYNVAAFLPECLDSIVQQTYPHLQIICINDGSTDTSADILHAYAQKDSRIMVVNQKNKGLSGARNTGLSHATGEYVAFIDSDDYIDRTYIEKLLTAMLSDNTVGLSMCVKKEVIDDTVQEFSAKYMHFIRNYGGKILPVPSYIEQCMKNNFFPAAVWDSLYKKTVIDAHSLTFIEGAAYEDLFFTVSYLISLAKTQCVAIVGEGLYFYRLRKGSIVDSGQQLQKNISDIVTNISATRDRVLQSDSYAYLNKKAYFNQILFRPFFQPFFIKFFERKAQVSYTVQKQTINSIKNLPLVKELAQLLLADAETPFTYKGFIRLVYISTPLCLLLVRLLFLLR